MKYQHLFDLASESVEHMLQRLEVKSDSFRDQVALVTGGARGIGEQTAYGLASLGVKVVVVDKLTQGKKVVESIREKGREALFLHYDISSTSNRQQAFDQILEHYGAPDIVMNNAVHFTIDSFLEMPIEEWDLHQQTNIGAAVHFSKLALPTMLKKKSGTILNMVALEGMAFAAAMSASKMAMRSLLFSLSNELKKDCGVNIMGFAPGLVATPLIADVFVKYCKRIGIDFEDYVLKLKHNKGYEGLMPPQHCAASLIHALANAQNFHGLIADPFQPLEKYGVINTEKPMEGQDWDIEWGDDVSENVTRLKEYILDITRFNDKIESRIEKRTKELNKEKEIIMGLMQELQSRNREAESTAIMLKAQKELLEKSNQELKNFAYIVSHDLKTPIRGIANLTAFIKSDLEGKLDENTLVNLKLLENRVERMESLVNGILDYSRAGGIQTKKSDINVEHLLKEVVDFINVPEQFSVVWQKEFPLLKANKTALQQVFQNLIGNAIKYHDKEAGKIEVKQLEKNGFFEFSIADDGPGIAPEYHERIFHMFQTLETKDEVESTGVGLAIVKKTIEESGGKVWVESAPGEGTTFKFKVPAS